VYCKEDEVNTRFLHQTVLSKTEDSLALGYSQWEARLLDMALLHDHLSKEPIYRLVNTKVKITAPADSLVPEPCKNDCEEFASYGVW
jgi:hypothetical protein